LALSTTQGRGVTARSSEMEMSVDRRTVISAFAARQWHLRRTSAELVFSGRLR